MADFLTNSNIRVHQALHGYADGHRLLACSTALKPRDLKAMLVMSDVSGPGAVIGDAGYLTGYPLPESGLYGLARTWPATEMPRPGCVWTHTLLVDFADLAVLSSMNGLAAAFRRPTETLQTSTYEVELSVHVPLFVPQVEDKAQECLRRIVWALYQYPKDGIIVSSQADAPDLVFLLWAQQWPRLRRTFRFCTLSFGDRSTEGSLFDLQFVPAERAARSRFSAMTDADRVKPSPEPWIDAAMADLCQGAEGTLRTFLREVGGELAAGREAFAPLCRLHQLMPDFGARPDSVQEAVDLLDSVFDAESANTLRTTLISTMARHPTAIGERAMGFFLKHLDLLATDDLRKLASDLGKVLWYRDPESLLRLFHESPPQPALAEQAIATLSMNDLIQGLRRKPQTITGLLPHRLELITHRDLWTIPGRWTDQALRVAAHDSDRTDAALAAIVSANRGDVVFETVKAFGTVKVLKAIADYPLTQQGEISPEVRSAWLEASVDNGRALAEFFSSSSSLDRALLLAIARRTSPDSIPNDFGEDPWWTAVRLANGDTDEGGRQYLSAYLLARALGFRSRNQAELIQFAFDAVYFPALESRLPQDAWAVIEPRLPRAWFFDWDHCQKMRAAVVDAFVDRSLSPLVFTRITRSDNLFEELARATGRTGRGRRFLRSALQSLMDEDESSSRIKTLEDSI